MARTDIPHSWSIANWPTTVWPSSERKARYFVRANKSALIQAGVLSRVGRDLIVLGARYSKWLELQASNVPGYEPAMNQKQAVEA
jgi:hypothetical protein